MFTYTLVTLGRWLTAHVESVRWPCNPSRRSLLSIHVSLSSRRACLSKMTAAKSATRHYKQVSWSDSFAHEGVFVCASVWSHKKALNPTLRTPSSLHTNATDTCAIRSKHTGLGRDTVVHTSGLTCSRHNVRVLDKRGRFLSDRVCLGKCVRRSIVDLDIISSMQSCLFLPQLSSAGADSRKVFAWKCSSYMPWPRKRLLCQVHTILDGALDVWTRR